MSVELKPVKGMADDAPSTIYLTSNWSEERGRVLTLATEHDYIQLERKRVISLVKRLNEWLDI